MSLGAQADRRQFGNQEADVYFYGEAIEKLGPRRYRLTRGGFTTCVQPTPRWEVTSGSVTLNLNDYAVARNTILRVKGVPVLYLPMIYYPIREDERATGFLLPTYGTSTVRGQAISNAFFWAINRSHGRHVLPRLVHEDRPGRRRRVSLRRGGAIHGRRAFLSLQPERDDVRRTAARPRRCRRPTATRSPAT